ncbi:MAG: 50S ribosomal protein L32 [Candidatus Paceibacterota bacterium]
MAVPKQRDSKSKVGKRRSQKNLKKQNISVCSECGAPKLFHRACSYCGNHKASKKKD